MSTTYSLVCDTCAVSLWAGQSNRIYPDAAEEFLYQHIGHEIRFLCDLMEDEKSEDYDEIL